MKGTPSRGRHSRHVVHIVCRRCGHKSYNIRKKRCSYCGYPDPKWRKYSWSRVGGRARSILITDSTR
ncbi:MAG: 50S ribosomal protein L37e [Nitrososphaeria archaeon]